MPLSEEEISEAKEAFTLFDADSSGSIPLDKIATALRSLGYTPAVSVIAEMEKDADPTNSGIVKIGDFLRQVDRAVKEAKGDKSQLKWLKEGMEFFWPEESADAKILKHLLKDCGEKLSSEEIDEFMRELHIENGQVNFEEFSKLLLTKYFILCYLKL